MESSSPPVLAWRARRRRWRFVGRGRDAARAPGAAWPVNLGHRGASSRVPENTLEAFRAALEDGGGRARARRPRDARRPGRRHARRDRGPHDGWHRARRGDDARRLREARRRLPLHPGRDHLPLPRPWRTGAHAARRSTRSSRRLASTSTSRTPGPEQRRWCSRSCAGRRGRGPHARRLEPTTAVHKQVSEARGRARCPPRPRGVRSPLFYVAEHAAPGARCRARPTTRCRCRRSTGGCPSSRPVS